MIIIKNGALVTPQGLRRADLAMEGDKIVRIAAAIDHRGLRDGRSRRDHARRPCRVASPCRRNLHGQLRLSYGTRRVE